MGILGSITGMFRTKINGAIEDMEDPIEMLDQKIRDMNKSLNDAKTSSAAVLGNIRQTEKQMNEAQATSDDYEAKVKQAMAANKKALEDGNAELAAKSEAIAKEALTRKIAAEASCATLTAAHASQKKQGEALKQKLRDLEAEVKKTQGKRSEFAARLASAEAGQKVGEILADVETKSNHISMDRIERKISQKEAMADGLNELADNSRDTLEDDLAALGAPNIDDELAKYR